MRRPLLPLFVLVLGFILACSGAGDGPGKRKPKRDKATVEAPADDAVDAYLADCHHVFPSEDQYGENPADECLAFEMDQNCSPDPSGCWDLPKPMWRRLRQLQVHLRRR